MSVEAKIFIVLCVIVVATLTVTFFLFLQDEVNKLNQAVKVDYDHWVSKLQKAEALWKSYNQHRGLLTRLEGCTGQTREHWVTVTSALDQLLIRIRGLDVECQQFASEANNTSIFRRGSQRRTFLAEPFKYHTLNINPNDLFAHEAMEVEIKPLEFHRDMQTLTTLIEHHLDILKEAAYLQQPMVEDLFPRANLEQLLDGVLKYHLPIHWIEDHPFFGDEETFACFYEQMADLQQTDPVSFQDALGRFSKLDRALIVKVEPVIHAMQMLDDVSRESFPILDTVVDTQMDYQVALVHARAREAQFRSDLPLLDPQEADSRCKEIRKLYREAESRYEEVQYHMKHVWDDLSKVRESIRRVALQIEVAEVTAERYDITTPRESIQCAVKYLTEARAEFAQAEQQAKQKQHARAVLTLCSVKALTWQATNFCADATTICALQDRERMRFMDQLGKMDLLRSTLMVKMARCGEHQVELTPFTRPSLIGGADYAFLSLCLHNQEVEWRVATYQAEVAHSVAKARSRQTLERVKAHQVD